MMNMMCTNPTDLTEKPRHTYRAILYKIFTSQQKIIFSYSTKNPHDLPHDTFIKLKLTFLKLDTSYATEMDVLQYDFKRCKGYV